MRCEHKAAKELLVTAAVGSLKRAQTRASVLTDDCGRNRCILSLPGIKCGACIAKIERALNGRSDVVSARVNLTQRQAIIVFEGRDTDPMAIIEALDKLGYPATPIQSLDQAVTDTSGRELLRAVAVAGFGAMNIMLLSVAVWSGADGQTRETFHLVSALIAVPVVIYAGQPFFKSAITALRSRQLNMDVPIALAVTLALALSVFETVQGGENVFFDAAVTLLFFLLTGRYLDHRMRERARSAVTGLAELSPRGALLRDLDGTLTYAALEDIAPGSILSIAPDEHVPLDVKILTGNSDLDRSLVTGESMAVAIGPGDTLEAGTLNLTGVIEVKVLRSSDDSFLSQMIQMQSNAEAGRGAYVRIADRAARLYAPVVHLLALATFLGWMLATGGDWQTSLFIAISVLIITCPCALGLAVPVAHVVAAGRLMRMGVLMKDGSAIERMAEIDRVVFDKTGTLTTGTPMIGHVPDDPVMRSGAKALALRSGHPAARAIASGLPETPSDVIGIEEVPGFGVEGSIEGRRARLGRAEWIAEIADVDDGAPSPAFGFEGGPAFSFDLTETLRDGACEAVVALNGEGFRVALLSGDVADRARAVAAKLGIEDVRYGATPKDKIEALEALRLGGHRTLMVGDGLNDAAALAAAHVSMAPSSACDAGRTAADFIFLRNTLAAVPDTWKIARDTARVVRQNFALAIGYNCIAVPLAVAGLVTPLIAALAMSGSSILVIANALRLNKAGGVNREKQVAPAMKRSEIST
ncbi:heavy metal translocating P-type ATPase [Roseovarius sp. M141]|uniref:heavy metal translocating P-type ATPase n=1 Tax=Roseovarius sp. M141 TaxID=2583806 RepID=UPI0020CE51C6|nr:heavy metal translocating P-type ATPase [Roseovarius sp. M141]MCQ0090282.1 cadmium-translocating P-type ATPase [Roseovarius sp. M141]